MRVDRLQNVIRALRERAPENFTMGRIMHLCGTPGCALGTYAAREDLQEDFILMRYSGEENPAAWAGLISKVYDEFIAYNDEEVLEHFGLLADDVEELFGEDGCRDAQTPEAAALYIEFFIGRRQAQQKGLQEIADISQELGLYDTKAS